MWTERNMFCKGKEVTEMIIFLLFMAMIAVVITSIMFFKDIISENTYDVVFILTATFISLLPLLADKI